MQRRSLHRSNKHHFSATGPLLLYSSMAVDKKLKLGIPRFFRIPFLSCRHRDVPDLAQKPVFISHRADHHLPKSHARPRRSLMTFFMEEVVADQSRIREGEGGERITPTSPLFPCIKPSEIKKQSNQRRMQAGKRRKKRRASAKSREAVLELANAITSNSSSGDSYHFFTSSDEEKHFGKGQEEAPFFSSMSSDSSATTRRKSARPRRKGSSSRRDEANSQLVEVDRSVAVVKRSSDPYADFRVSMAEMIIEKQIFGTVELEKLLECFLALNAPYHKQVIVEVFEEICETLFCNLA